jgi:membrane dipeptidase
MKTRREFLKRTAAGGIAGIIASGAAPVYAQGKRVKKNDVTLEQARKVHNRMLIIDGHNDTPVERVARKENPMNWMQRDPSYHTDIPRMKEGGYDGGFFIVGNGPTANVWVTTERVLEQIEKYPDDLMQVLASKDIVRAHESRKIGVILAIEGIGRWLDGNVDTLRLLYRLGIRLAGITHGEGGSEPTFLQGTPSIYRPCTPEEREADRKNAGGLTPFGMDVLKTSNELGMVTDLSHINDRAFYDVLEHSSLPPIMSHTAVFSLCNHARCMTDDQIKALASAGGAMGIAFAPQFIDPDPVKATIDRVAEHICYVGDLVGMDYVAIGTDYDGLGKTIPVVPEVSQLVQLTRSMLAYGMSEDEIRKVWGGNFLRILQKTIDRKS